ncbi:MAG TPA: hypothetical protein VKA54_06865, partial [Gemmatimonadaceae bacterium]|nr:hypothetical protein [Gemmatimonadaceae bacterium]
MDYRLGGAPKAVTAVTAPLVSRTFVAWRAGASDLAAIRLGVDVVCNTTVHAAGGSMRTIAPLFALLLTLSHAAAAQSPRATSASNAAPVARFDWFEYSGRDS